MRINYNFYKPNINDLVVNTNFYTFTNLVIFFCLIENLLNQEKEYVIVNLFFTPQN